MRCRRREGKTSSQIVEPTMMVQNVPAHVSAIKAPTSGVRLAAPSKLVIVLEAVTDGMFSTWVR